MKSKYKVLPDGFVFKIISNKFAIYYVMGGQKPVYVLYPDGTESLVGDLQELNDISEDSSVKFGIESPFRFKFITTKANSNIQSCRLYLNNRYAYCCVSKMGHKHWAAIYTSDYENERHAHKVINGNRESAFNFLLNRVEGYYKRLTKGL